MRAQEAIHFRDAMLDHGLPCAPASILHCLIRHANTRHFCTIGRRSLARQCAMSRGTVDKHTAWMAKVGIIKRNGAERERCEFHIQSPRLWKTSHFEEGRARYSMRSLKSGLNNGSDAGPNNEPDAAQLTSQIRCH